MLICTICHQPINVGHTMPGGGIVHTECADRLARADTPELRMEVRVRKLADECIATADGEGYELCQMWLRDRDRASAAKLTKILRGRE